MTDRPAKGRLGSEIVGEGRPVTLVHGFAQTRLCWGPVGGWLADRARCRLLDAPGHGESSDVHVDLWDAGRLVLDESEGAVLVGYSMGARMALHAAVLDARGNRTLGGLVLISGTGGIEDSAERAERRASDERLAERIVTVGVDAFIDEWLSLTMFRGLPGWARFDDERRSNTAEGLASSLRLAGTGTQTPLWDELAEVRVPTLVLTGALDEKFTALGARLASTLPNARHVVVPGAGHSVHLEAPDAAAEAVLDFTGTLPHDP